MVNDYNYRYYPPSFNYMIYYTQRVHEKRIVFVVDSSRFIALPLMDFLLEKKIY